ncbi:MAG: hypothetical protein QNJ12_11250 [Ilumatobacter sp.]|uniref:hypothetical protein n=1 Tax=Ilumatobacter sp. TaxID=1967498 RepID=UPI0026160702|nr:hypothetical protein [Ilumatobacter sp.]MDJ0769366.1 hypothetical protein [Ilumatobacter sp.]
MTAADDDAARRSRLIGIKLRALVADHLSADVGDVREFAPGAALLHDDAAWVYLDDRPGQRLGASLAWALRAGARSLDVIAAADTGVLARRAGEFAFPISVWHADERSLLAAIPEPFEPTLEVPAHHLELRQLIADGGADPIVEHGVLVGEVRGLEVCRVVDDPATGVTRLEVGVGAHDREAFQMLHGDVPAVESLARVVDIVAEVRSPGAPQHPLNRLGAERLIRWQVEQRPELVGAAEVRPAEPPVARTNLKDPTPCVGTGTTSAGERLVVVCASGVDLEVVPYAADARLAAERAVEPGSTGGSRLVLAMPARDRLPLTDELAGLLTQPAEFVAVG